MYPGQTYPDVQDPTTQFDLIPKMYLVLQSPTTPGQFDMCRNPDVPRSDVPHPLLIEPSATEPYYTGQFDMHRNPHVPRSDVPHPLLIEPSATET